MPIKIHGNEYYTVAERVNLLDGKYPGRYSIQTAKVEDNQDYVEVQATLTIQPLPDTQLESTTHQGYAREYYKGNAVNRTSALENAETSAIGRALAAANLSGSGEYASANEVLNADKQLSKKQQQQPVKKVDPSSNGHLAELKETLAKYDLSEVEQAIIKLRGEEKLSPSKQQGYMSYYSADAPTDMRPPETITQAITLYQDNNWKPFTATSLDWTPQQVKAFVSNLEKVD